MHLTIGETAFLAPAGVILGAVVSYFAVRKSAGDNLTAQKETINANREIAGLTLQANRELAEQARERDEARERRQHQRDAYVSLMGLAAEIGDAASELATQLDLWDETEAQGGEHI